jgi:dihydroorotate dehydrogenase (fumarate)
MSDIDLSTTLAGIPLSTCIYNASGPRSGTAAALQKIAASQAGAVLTKSATLGAQTGNPLRRTHHAEHASFNSEGLPNNGIEYYISADTIDECMQTTTSSKPYIVSLSGKTLEDNIEMIERIAKAPSKIAAIELNLACPNIIGKPIIAYDFEQMELILSTIAGVVGKLRQQLPPLGIKLPPYLDLHHMQTAAALCNAHESIIQYVVCCNTMGNALAIDTVAEAPHIRANDGFAGLSGPAIKYAALANVRTFRRWLHSSIDVVGVGGVETGHDAFALILAGATAVQVGTCHWNEGPQCFDRICNELKQLMEKKNYSSVNEFKGKLKVWTKEGAALSRHEQMAAKTHVETDSTRSEASIYKALSCVLAMLLAFMCAQKWTTINLLPSEGMPGEL